ncbi:hypothetical protein SDC9_187965 [bioreactor metagenome]|uniref:Uncharacterized protein n=1 Tax=bioreactor metagenome TaxID=1076179 RepID=A0A645HN13_9ZZZZ
MMRDGVSNDILVIPIASDTTVITQVAVLFLSFDLTVIIAVPIFRALI